MMKSFGSSREIVEPDRPSRRAIALQLNPSEPSLATRSLSSGVRCEYPDMAHRYLFGDRRIPHPSAVLHFTLEFTVPLTDLCNSWGVEVSHAEPTLMPNHFRRAYLTDLTDSQWAVIAPMIPEAVPGGRPRKADKREIVQAILYVLRLGCAWRLLPHDFPPWQTVYSYLRRWERAGREASPSAAILDSQTVRTADQKGASRGMVSRGTRHGSERRGERKTHPRAQAAFVSTDTDGRLLAVEVHGAEVQDRDGAKGILK
jgi:transposase